VLCVDDVYGGTQRYFRKIIEPQFGIKFTFKDMSDPESLRQYITKDTKIVWMESPTNPTLKFFDIEAIGKVVHEQNPDCIYVVDNTFFTPYLQNPLELGADVSFHSVSKYIGGHSDVLMGALCLNSKELYERIWFIQNTVGTGAAAFDCFLALRGMKTLGIRMERHCENAMKVAQMLEKHSSVTKVTYPGLESFPSHSLAKRVCKNGFGGMVCFYVKGGLEGARTFLQNVKVITLAESLGGVESLVESPALMTHASVPQEMRKELGIDDDFIRLSVGIEDEADLLQDLQQALDKVN